MKYSIEDLRNGKVAVINDGTVEELGRVLQEAFPNQSVDPEGTENIYIRESNKHWIGKSFTKLPTQSVKEFLNQEEEFKWGEDVETTDYECIWHSGYVFIGNNPITKRHICVSKSDGSFGEFEKIRKPQTELTRQQIAEKFGIPVEQLIIKD